MFSMAIHAGAGSVTRANTTADQEKQYHQGLQEALSAGYVILANGGSALDAVEESVIALENNPAFNAGRGSVFTSAGKHEMDAAMMDGSTRRAGAAAGISQVQNPIRLARKILENSDNVLLIGDGAEAFARKNGLPFKEAPYFFTEHRHRELLEKQEKSNEVNTGKGTVGAVALDVDGNLAVATSTGGLTNKKFGRVGDTPVIGAGTYAHNNTCAVSCTGDGEYFIRLVTAYDVSCLMLYQGLALREACRVAIKDKLTGMGGEGGLIAVDRMGNIELVSNCEGMLRAWMNHLGEGQTAIWS